MSDVPREYAHFPKQWPTLPFMDAVADVTSGNAKVQQRDYLEHGLLAIVDQGKGMIAGYTDDASAACGVSPPVVVFGDHTRELKFVDFPFALGADGVKVLKPKVALDERFLFHYLTQVRLPNDAGYSRHFKFLKRVYVPLPPLPEQKRIAAILDKADDLRKKRQEAIRLTEELLRSAFLEMFGDYLRPDRCRPLKEVCSVLLDCRNKTAPYEPSGIPLIRTTNFRNNSLDLSSLKYVSDATNKVWSSRHQTSPGDVVYCREAPFGMAAIVPEGFFPCLGQRIMVARPDQESVTTKFLWTALNSPFVFTQAERVAVGATVKHLRVGDVEKLAIPVPPLTLQKKFSRMSDAIASLAISFGASMRLTEASSSALTQSAFSGRL